MEIKYSRYQIDNIHGSLYLFLVDKSVDANNHCFLNNNVNSYSIKAQLGSLDLYQKFESDDVYICKERVRFERFIKGLVEIMQHNVHMSMYLNLTSISQILYQLAFI